jgi:GT2 family glycosyltransferase
VYLSVVIVTYNSADVLGACLRALPEAADVVVVDNASSRDPEAVVREAREDALLVRLQTNIGFGAGCNLGARHAPGDVLIFLNPDVIPDPGALELLASRAREQPNLVLGPELLTVDGKLRYECCKASRIVYELVELFPLPNRFAPRSMTRYVAADSPVYRFGGPVDWVQGACLAVHRRTFEALGGFDEDFFLYGEEESLCSRVRMLGGQTVYEPRARVRHVGETSTSNARSLAVFHYFRSRVLTFRKSRGAFWGQLAAVLIALALGLRGLGAAAGGPKFRRGRGFTPAYFRAAYSGLVSGSRARLEHPRFTWLGSVGV